MGGVRVCRRQRAWRCLGGDTQPLGKGAPRDGIPHNHLPPHTPTVIGNDAPAVHLCLATTSLFNYSFM